MTKKNPPSDDGLPHQIEAILFAGGRPLAAREIGETLGVADRTALQHALAQLVQEYAGRSSALELKRVGDRYALQLREEYVPVARPVTPMEMAPRTLKALTLVAYHQPMLQSFLVRMLGDGAYEEVGRLRGMGLIHAATKGSTLELSTTRAFAEYFGIGSTRPEEIRRYLEGKLGAGAGSSASPVPPGPLMDAPPEALPTAATEDPGSAPDNEYAAWRPPADASRQDA
jgi:segregation and condensation protein B